MGKPNYIYQCGYGREFKEYGIKYQSKDRKSQVALNIEKS